MPFLTQQSSSSPFSSSNVTRAVSQGYGGFPNPWLDIASMAMPDHNQNALEWCLPPGTLVEVGGLQQYLIEDVVANLKVLAKDGESHRVERVSTHVHTGELVQLWYDGFGLSMPHQMTPDHKVWYCLKPGDKIVREAAETVPIGAWVATPLPKRYATEVPRFSGALLGAYLAEGYVIQDSSGSRGVRFVFGADDEASGFIHRVCKLLEAQLDIATDVYTPETRKDLRLVTVYDGEFADWCLRLGGRNSTAKRLACDVMAWPDEELSAMLGAWIDGDGWGTPTGASGCTSSKTLAMQLLRVANSIGMVPAMLMTDNKKGKGKDNGKKSYRLTFANSDARRLSGCVKTANLPVAKMDRRAYYIEGNYVYRQIKGRDFIDYTGPVYNIEVEGDHSFIADGVVTSNCEHVYDSMGTYRQSQERIISYFLTEIDVESPNPNEPLGDDEKDKWRGLLHDRMGMLDTVQKMHRSRTCYGNAFSTMIVPFKRFLVCPKCHTQFPLSEMHGHRDFRFEWQLPKFIATCPRCAIGSGFRGEWDVNDMPEDLERKLKVKVWNPKEIEILFDEYSQDAAYLWRIPEDYKKQVRSGSLWHLEHASMPVIRAIQNNNLFRFNPDVMFHMAEPVLPGRRSRGWGISKIIYNFRQIWYVQVLRRYNEAIGLDYIIPFRLITPEARTGGGGMAGGKSTDPMKALGMGNYAGQFMQMMADRRRNPAGWNFLPFPVTYQALGGDATKLAPTELLNQAYEVMLNDAGTPIDFYKGTLQLQTAPVGLRLFEATHTHLNNDTNNFLRWVVEQISQILSWELVRAKMRRVTYADDFNIQMAQLQLMMGQAISQTTGLRAMGLDWDTEQRQIAEESRRQAEMQAEIQEEMEQAAFGEQIAKGQPQQGGQPGAAPPGGDPAAAGGQGGAMPPGGSQTVDPMTGQPAPGPVTGMLMGSGVPQSMDDMMSQAEDLAMQMLSLPESQRHSELRLLKNKNEVLHSLVKAKMDQVRGKARTAGASMLLGQQGAAAA